MILRNILPLTIEAAGNEGAAGGGTPPASANGSENNNGQTPEFDPNKFWAAPAEVVPAPKAPAATSSQTPSESASPLAAIVQKISEAKFGNAAFLTPDVLNKMGENDFTGFNGGLESFGRDVLAQSAQTTSAMLQHVIPAFLQHVTDMVESKFGGRDMSSFLESNLQAAKDPALAPVVRNIFDIAMKQTKGDKNAALAMTRTMLQTVGTGIAKDVDLTLPTSNGNSSSIPVDWLKELGALGSQMERK